MTTSKFQVKFINQYIVELFGNQDVREPILVKDISQKVKYHLKKLGNTLQEEYKTVIAQLQEMFDKYSEEVTEAPEENVAGGTRVPGPKKRIKEEFKEQFLKESSELEDMEIEVSHYSFTERDFIDHSTGDVVGGNIYFNLIDLLVFSKEDESQESKVFSKPSKLEAV